MFSIAFVFRRRPGMTLDEFYQHYENVHAGVATRMPGLLSYIQHPVRQDAPVIGHNRNELGFDAMSIYTYESDAAAAAAFVSEISLELEADSAKFIDFETMITLPVTVRQVL